MIRLAAFADEIAAEPVEQIAVLQREGVHGVDLRAAWGTNVLDLHDGQIASLKELFEAVGITVTAIASPLGKTPIDAPVADLFHRFERAVTLAHTFDAPCIRVFSFYAPADGPVDRVAWRAEAVTRLSELARRAEASGLVLLLENEKEVYGDTVTHCVDLLQSVDSPALRAAFDPANFVQCGEAPYPAGYDALRPWIGYVHVKDALPDGSVVAAGRGVSRWPRLLARLRSDCYTGTLSLEPHLAAAGQYAGFSGPSLFAEACGALRAMLDDLGWAYD